MYRVKQQGRKGWMFYQDLQDNEKDMQRGRFRPDRKS
jgi:hypothetical protein